MSTCHRAGYELYGREMLESFDRYWPPSVPLQFYAEGFEVDVVSSRIRPHDLHASCPDLVAFKERHASSRVAHGSGAQPRWQLRVERRPLKIKLRRKRSLGYRWDAVRFSHKVFAFAHAAREAQADVLVALDADLLFTKALPPALLETLIPRDFLCAYLARPKFSECSFVAYNLRHPATSSFLDSLEDLYVSDRLFRERQWHDSYLFDVVRQRFERQGHRFVDIGEGVGRRRGDVLGASRLGDYMVHRKGDRKLNGARSAVL